MRTHYKFTQYILIFLISSVTLLFAKDNNNNVDKSFNTSYSPAVGKNTNIIEQNIAYKVPSSVSVIALNKFDYHLTNNELVFVWETSKEINSFVFELQRLNRASDNWEKVGHVVAFGISEEKRTYKLMEKILYLE